MSLISWKEMKTLYFNSVIEQSTEALGWEKGIQLLVLTYPIQPTHMIMHKKNIKKREEKLNNVTND